MWRLWGLTKATMPIQLTQILNTLRRGEFAMAIGVMGIVALLFVPLPAMLLDVMFALSISAAVLILLNVLFIRRAMDFSSFPTLLLVTTLLRLALNIASTRLILTNGHSTGAAAGRIIEAFGQIIMSGEFLVGLMIFIIYVVFNFVVITKGATRIAEVAARFTLDSLPGKQMAIDADLNAGLITEEQARHRRQELEYETSFYGAMDGASKFVRGDAIAGLIITAINIVAGISAGMMLHDMTFDAALKRFTLLTVGDGLVAMVPALIISLASGFLVSKSRTEEASGAVLIQQFAKYPRAMFIASGLLLLISLLPGIPLLPFWLLAGSLIGLGYLSMMSNKQAETDAELKAAEAETAAAPAEEPISSVLHIDTLKLELGYGLLGLIDESKGGRLTEQIKAMRRQLAKEIGFVVPSIRIQDNMQLDPGGYVISIKDISVGDGILRPGKLLAMDRTGESPPLDGETTTEPTFGLPAKWIDEVRREEASFNGYMVVDCSTVLVTHLTEVIKDNLSELLTRNETQKLLDELGPQYKKLVEEIIPGQFNMGNLQKVLQNLLAERVSIRDLPSILEAISDAVSVTKNVQVITEMVRARLSRQISTTYTSPEGFIPIINLSGAWERTFSESVVPDGDDRQLAMEPTKVQSFLRAVKENYEKSSNGDSRPVLLTSPTNRPFVRSLLERTMPSVPVLSQQEIHPKARIKTVGSI